MKKVLRNPIDKHGIRILDRIHIHYFNPDRKDILDKTNGVCFYCGKKLQNKKPKCKDYMTIDHVVPLSLQGPDIIKNKVPACKRCNLDKADKLIDIW